MSHYNPDQQMEKWTPKTEVAPGPVQDEAEKLANIFGLYGKRLRKTRYADEDVVPTPEVRFDQYGHSGIAFFFKDEDSLVSFSANISGYIKEDATRDRDEQEYRFVVDPKGGTITSIDSLEPVPDIILLQSAIEYTQSQLAREEELRYNHRTAILKRTVGALVTLAVAGGIYEGIDHLVKSNQAAARRAAAARVDFDKQILPLPGNVRIATLDVRDIPADIFKIIPSYKKHDTLENARKFKLDENTCKTFDTIVGPNEKLAVVTSKKDVLQNQPIIAGLNDQNKLVVCSTHEYPDDHASWSLAVQLKK